MLKANPIIIDDKCNIQDGIVFHDLIGCLKGLYPRGDTGREVHGGADEAIGIHGYGHGRDPRMGLNKSAINSI